MRHGLDEATEDPDTRPAVPLVIPSTSDALGTPNPPSDTSAMEDDLSLSDDIASIVSYDSFVDISAEPAPESVISIASGMSVVDDPSEDAGASRDHPGSSSPPRVEASVPSTSAHPMASNPGRLMDGPGVLPVADSSSFSVTVVTEQPQEEKTPTLSWHCKACRRDPCDTPVATICGHVFCQGCILLVLSNTGACPVCERMFLIHLDVAS